MMYLYSVKDVKVGFMTPKPAVSDGQIIRLFVSAVMDDQEGNEFSLYADDMELWRVGKFNEETGQLLPESPKFICSGRQYKHMKIEVNDGEILSGESPVLADVLDNDADASVDLSGC